MHVSALEEYAVRCALQLARSFEAGPVSASKIAEREGLSVEYVSKIMHLFRKSGVVSAARGNQGGFFLSRAPEEFPLSTIIASVSGRKDTEEFCARYTGQNAECAHSCSCSIRPVWNVLSSYFFDVLDEIKLGDLLARENEVAERVRQIAKRQANEIRSYVKGEAK